MTEIEKKWRRLDSIYFILCYFTILFTIFVMWKLSNFKDNKSSLKEQIIRDYPNITMEELAPLTERNLVELQNQLNQERIKDIINKRRVNL